MDHLYTLKPYYQKAVNHQKNHKCTGVPYDDGDVLTAIVAEIKPQRVLELGTGLGYSTACIASGFHQARIETIEQDELHIRLAKSYWQEIGITNRITAYSQKAEEVLPTLTDPYDMIFFDGKAPSIKFLTHFERLLKNGGVLITANLFLKDPKGGVYMRHLAKQKNWNTGVFNGTALSVKR